MIHLALVEQGVVSMVILLSWDPLQFLLVAFYLQFGIFLGYSTSSKAFRVFNKRTMVVEESIHVIFYKSNNSLQERENIDDDLGLNLHGKIAN